MQDGIYLLVTIDHNSATKTMERVQTVPIAIELQSTAIGNYYLSSAQLISLPCPEPLYFLLIYLYGKTYEQDFVGTRNTVQRLN